MTILALLRHAETDWSAARRLQGRTDIPLNDAGRRAVSGRRIPSACHAMQVVSSPLLRCTQTAQCLGLAPVSLEPRLTEMSWGDWEGRTLAVLRDALGVAIFLVAIVGETVSDNQMKGFRANPANRGQVMDRGLWAWSRHPNYFFQWLGWMAYPAMALVPTQPVTWLSLTAPIVMYGLLRYVSGVPLLEQTMLKSRGDLFRAYQQRVSVFFPFPPKAR